MVGVGFVFIWVILAGLYHLHPVLPLILLTIFWGLTIGLALGLGGRLWWVVLQCIILPATLVFEGYEVGGWQGSVVGLLQFANMLDFAGAVEIVVALTSAKMKSMLKVSTE